MISTILTRFSRGHSLIQNSSVGLIVISSLLAFNYHILSLSPFFMALYSNSTHLSLVSSPVLGTRWELLILGENISPMGLGGLWVGALPSLLSLAVWEPTVTLGGLLSVACCCSTPPPLLPLLMQSCDTGGVVGGWSFLVDFASFLTAWIREGDGRRILVDFFSFLAV